MVKIGISIFLFKASKCPHFLLIIFPSKHRVKDTAMFPTNISIYLDATHSVETLSAPVSEVCDNGN